MNRPQIVGIVNITTDSFSDGGRFVTSDAAIAHAKKLLIDGADIIELSGASSNPHAESVSANTEIERITSVLADTARQGLAVSIDSTKSDVQRFAMSKKVMFLNDIRGFPDELLYPELAISDAKLIVMHLISDLDKAVRVPKSSQEVFDSIYSFFEERLLKLINAGISKERIVMDPGMGFFLASNPGPSLAALTHIAELKKHFKLPIMISVSRKSFLRLPGWQTDNFAQIDDSDIQSRTLAAEIFAATQGADYIRTHDARALNHALTIIEAIEHGASEVPHERQS